MTSRTGTWQWDSNGLVTADRHAAEIYSLGGAEQPFERDKSKAYRFVHPDDRDLTEYVLARSLRDATPFATVHRVARIGEPYATVYVRGSTLAGGGSRRLFGMATVLHGDATSVDSMLVEATLPTELLVAAREAAFELRRDFLAHVIGISLLESLQRDVDRLGLGGASRH